MLRGKLSMSVPTSTEGVEGSRIVWQEGESVGEPAILIEVYEDSVQLTQEDRTLSISRPSLAFLIKNIRQAVKAHDER